MSLIDPVALLIRWLHIVPAVVAGGGAIFVAIAFVPGLASSPAESRAAVRDAVVSRWRPILMVAIGLLLVSGIMNFMMFQAPRHEGQAIYHALFGLKFLMALVVFFLASALVGTSPALESIRAKTRLWSLVNAALVLAIVLVSGVLKTIPTIE